jgi:hypothetical protein
LLDGSEPGPLEIAASTKASPPLPIQYISSEITPLNRGRLPHSRQPQQAQDHEGTTQQARAGYGFVFHRLKPQAQMSMTNWFDALSDNHKRV